MRIFCYRGERTKTENVATIGNLACQIPTKSPQNAVSVPDRPPLNFADTIASLDSGQVWQYERWPRKPLSDLPHATYHALQTPRDFPPMEAAIVPGDRVALAVDPNAPSIVEVVEGVLRALGETEAGDVDIVLWDEADDHTLARLQHEVGQATRVIRHQSSDRSSLRYLGADQDAEPVYLNRRLVDADFVLPIVVGRPHDTRAAHDLTGIFPSFADSASRSRLRRGTFAKNHSAEEAVAHAVEPRWLLGVQMMLCVMINDEGEACEVVAGTPDAIHKELSPSRPAGSEYPPASKLVVASLDGDTQQQTWTNAARAISAASHYVEPGGTIVLWSDIENSPSGCMLELGADETIDFDAIVDPPREDESDFPAWDPSNAVARTIQRVAAEYRILVHSRLSEEEIESMGLAVIHDNEELARLSKKYESCGVLRAAQFAGTTLDSEPIKMKDS